MSTRRRRKSLNQDEEGLRCNSPYNAHLSTIIDEEFQKSGTSRTTVKGRCYLANKKMMHDYTSNGYILSVIVFMMTMTSFIIYVHTNKQSLLPTSRMNYQDPVSNDKSSMSCANCNGISEKEKGLINKNQRIFFFSTEETDFKPQQYVYYQHQRGENHHNIDPMLHVNQGEETGPQPIIVRDGGNGNDDHCTPMQKWQLYTFPTCNNIHELDLKLYGARSSKMTPSSSHVTKVNGENGYFHLIGSGWFRNTFLMESVQESVVLKTLR